MGYLCRCIIFKGVLQGISTCLLLFTTVNGGGGSFTTQRLLFTPHQREVNYYALIAEVNKTGHTACPLAMKTKGKDHYFKAFIKRSSGCQTEVKQAAKGSTIHGFLRQMKSRSNLHLCTFFLCCLSQDVT